MRLTNPLLVCAAALGCGCTGAFSQEGAPKNFQLLLPDFFENKPFDGNADTIEIQPKPIRNLQIQVIDAAVKNIGYGRIVVRINGKGMGNAFDRKANEKGALMVMNPQTIGLRPDQVFDPVENAIEVTAEDRRGRRYYHNWLVKANEKQPNSFFAYTSAVSPSDPGGFPPDLFLTEPSQPIVLAPGAPSAKVAVKGILSSPQPGSSIKLNGKTWIPPVDAVSADFEETITVTRAMKDVTFEAVDKKGNRRSVVIPVIAQGAAAPRARFAGNRYAVLIGISDYGKDKDSPPPLRSAASDASEIARVLMASGFPQANIRLLKDAEANADQIRVAFSDFAAKAGPDDVLVVYVAAHGLHDPFSPDKMYLAPHGTRLKQIDISAIALEELSTRLLRNVRSKNTLMFFDVGHRAEGEFKFPGKNLVNNTLLRVFGDDETRAVLVSGSTDELSQQRKTTGEARSLFAHWVSQALSGAADLNGDRAITGQEAVQFVAEKVKAETRGAQNPRYVAPRKVAEAPIAALK
jgi:hypothetical protein